MTGTEFYSLLRNLYQKDSQFFYGNYSSKKWLPQDDNKPSFQFKGKKQTKSIPFEWLVHAKEAQNRGEQIHRKWFNELNHSCNSNDCRASVAMWLLEQHGE